MALRLCAVRLHQAFISLNHLRLFWFWIISQRIFGLFFPYISIKASPKKVISVHSECQCVQALGLLEAWGLSSKVANDGDVRVLMGSHSILCYYSLPLSWQWLRLKKRRWWEINISRTWPETNTNFLFWFSNTWLCSSLAVQMLLLALVSPAVKWG